MGVAEIKAELSRGRTDDRIIALCFKILDFLSRTPEPDLRMLTFRTLSLVVEKKKVDSDLLTAITILVSSNVAALDARALLIDDDETEYDLSPEDLAEARISGELIHPYTGYPVHDFEAKVFPYFVPTSRVLSRDR